MKENRVEFRSSDKERELFKAAASYLGMNLSSFLRMIALEKSNEIIKNSIVLSERDRDIFMTALENPPKPNKNLKIALSEYKKLKI